MNSVITRNNTGSDYEVKTHVSKEILLEKEGERPFRIYLIGFRKQMRKTVADFPELAAKIGQEGYRYKNLKKILIEYNKWYEDTRIML
jgi:hypothetical protein